MEGFFFWLILLFFSELCYARSSVAYAAALIFSLILLVVLRLFWYDYDLFASVLLAIYSSVFILLSLFILYFSRYWGFLGAAQTFGEWAAADLVLIFAATVASAGFFFVEGAAANSAFWSLRAIAYDYYATPVAGGAAAAATMHSLLYKFYAVDVYFFNVFLLFGLVLSVGLVYLFKLWLNPATAAHIFSSMRFTFHFYLPSNFRIRVANKFKRQTRRKNSSHVKYRRDL